MTQVRHFRRNIGEIKEIEEIKEGEKDPCQTPVPSLSHETQELPLMFYGAEGRVRLKVGGPVFQNRSRGRGLRLNVH